MTDLPGPDLAECLCVGIDNPLTQRLVTNAVRWLASGGMFRELAPGVPEVLTAAFVNAAAHFMDMSWFDADMPWPEIEERVREGLADYLADLEEANATEASEVLSNPS